MAHMVRYGAALKLCRRVNVAHRQPNIFTCRTEITDYNHFVYWHKVYWKVVKHLGKMNNYTHWRDDNKIAYEYRHHINEIYMSGSEQMKRQKELYMDGYCVYVTLNQHMLLHQIINCANKKPDKFDWCTQYKGIVRYEHIQQQ